MQKFQREHVLRSLDFKTAEHVIEHDVVVLCLCGELLQREQVLCGIGFQDEDELSDLEKLLRKYNIKKNTTQKNQEDGNKISVELEDKLEENLIDK